MTAPLTLIGHRFGRLTVTSRVTNDYRGRTRWMCRCDCGADKVFARGTLTNGYAKSCGCLRKELMRERMEKFWSGHG